MSRLIDADLLLNDKNKKMVGEYVYNLMHCLVSDMPTVKAIPIDRVKQIREEIEERVKSLEWKQKCVDEILEIIDKAIKEVNE